MGKIAAVVDVSSARTISDMLQQSGTDWDAKVVPAGMTLTDINGGGFKAIVRPDSNTALAFVGDRYRTNSHRDQLGKLETYVANGDILPHNVSVWDNGAIMAYQFRVPSLDANIIGSDRVSTLLTLMFSYGFRVADMAFFGGFRAFCKNQMGLFAKLAGDDRVRHRGDVNAKYHDVLGRRISELGGELTGRFDTMRRMTTTPLKGRALAEYFGEAIGATKEEIDQSWVTPKEDLRGTAAKLPDVIDCYAADDCGAEGTVWQAYNAVTRYGTHKNGRSEANRQRTMLMGAGQTMAARAWDAARSLAL